MENKETFTRWPSLAGIWFGGVVSVPALIIGSSLISGLSFGNAVWVGLIGFCFVIFFMSLLSVAAVEKRKATVDLAASSFGHTGAKIIVGLVVGLSTLGWFGIQSNIAGASFTQIMVEMNGPDIPSWASSVFCCCPVRHCISCSLVATPMTRSKSRTICMTIKATLKRKRSTSTFWTTLVTPTNTARWHAHAS